MTDDQMHQLLMHVEKIVRRVVSDELDNRNLKRSPDLTAAERMRRYRERKAAREAAGKDALRQAARLLDK